MSAPAISAFGDGSHAPGASSLVVDGGGFGAFPGGAWIYANADLTGNADQLTVGSWNDLQLTVTIPGTLTNTPGTRYLFVQREDLAWSNGFPFTLESTADTGDATDSAAATDAASARATAFGSRAESAAATDVKVGVAAARAIVSDVISVAEVRAGLATAAASSSDSALATDIGNGLDGSQQAGDAADTVVVDDGQTASAVSSSAFADSAAVSDAALGTVLAFGARTDTVSVTDSAPQQQTRFRQGGRFIRVSSARRSA
jgi:hypothetical protein